jgi:hypothetical protein
MGNKESILPAGYTKIKGIKSNGGYFEIPKRTLRNYLIGIRFNSNGNNNWVFGCVTVSGDLGDVGISSSSIRFSTSYVRDLDMYNGDYIVEESRYGYSINGVYTTWSNVVNSIHPIPYFRILHARGSSLVPSGTVYEAYIKDVDTGEYIYHYVPCIRQNDNKIGLYEVVEGVFILPTGNVEVVN